MAEKKIKEDPPELQSKVDKVVEKPVVADDVVEVKESEAFKEAPEVSPSSADFALLMEQNRILLAKLEEMSKGPEKEVAVKSGEPVLDMAKPYMTQRTERAAWREQDGNKFSMKGAFIGKAE